MFSLPTKNGERLFEVITIGETGEMISARNGLKVLPTANIKDELELDILIIPGGYGAEEIEIKNQIVINWIKDQKSKVKIIASVCTGAFLLAKSGILDNKSATTHWLDIERFEKEFPNVQVIKHVKFVDEGDVLTSAGISAGIEMSFHMVKKIFGVDVAKSTAQRMEYDIEI